MEQGLRLAHQKDEEAAGGERGEGKWAPGGARDVAWPALGESIDGVHSHGLWTEGRAGCRTEGGGGRGHGGWRVKESE
jgi:hypothetical protein